MKQIGARFMRKQKDKLTDRQEVITSHYKPEISIPVKDGVRKRPRVLKRNAD